MDLMEAYFMKHKDILALRWYRKRYPDGDVSSRYVLKSIKRYNEDASVDERLKSGRPWSVRTPAAIKAVKARIPRNPKRKQKLLAFQMGLSRTTVKRVLNEDLGLRAYRRKRGHRLNARLMDLRLKRCRALLKRSEEASNRIPRVQRGHFPSSLMVWHWVFQQDSAPAHRAKSTQNWLAAREIDFIRPED
ncbi:hypothetical protein evm_001552 [Chilo suppressalis]|nr:hypothetical protein evm_001552 [Chilo suppressalis]